MLEHEVLPLDPAEVAQRLNERGPVPQLGLVEVRRRRVPDVIDLGGLLRLRRGRGQQEARRENRQGD
jgi:hypothetical protein